MATSGDLNWPLTAGAAARRLHRQPIPTPLERPSRYRYEEVAKLLDWLASRGFVDPGVLADHGDRARAVSVASVVGDTFVHGDFQAEHVRIGRDGSIAGVIDWGDAGAGDGLYDLAVLTVGHVEHVDAVIEGYGADIDRERLAGYWSLRKLGSIRWMVEHGFDPSGDVAALND